LISMSQTFYNCDSLFNVPSFNTSGVTTTYRCFYTVCANIRTFGAWDLSSVTDGRNMVNGAPYNLAVSNFYGGTFTDSYKNCNLDRANIVNIFNNLGTSVGQTIDVSANPGTVDLTAGDIAIATNKGWAVTV